LIVVTDSSHEAWWRGTNKSTGLDGFFPSNFVELSNSPSQPTETPKKSTDEIVVNIPLDPERVTGTLENLRAHDPSRETPLPLKFNEKICSEMTSTIVSKVHALDSKFEDINNINERFKNILQAFQTSQPVYPSYQEPPQNYQQNLQYQQSYTFNPETHQSSNYVTQNYQPNYQQYNPDYNPSAPPQTPSPAVHNVQLPSQPKYQ